MFGLIMLLIAAALPLRADTFYILVDDFAFSPATQTIQVGDTVTWINNDGNDFPHTTTSTLPFGNANYWNGLLAGVGDDFSHTFANAGTFTYTDQSGSGTGTIMVATAPTAITLDAPRIVSGKFIFNAAGLAAGKTNVVQASTNLISWTAISTNVATGATATFTNPASVPTRLFRVLQLP